MSAEMSKTSYEILSCDSYIDYVSNDTGDSCNNRSVGQSVNDWSLLNVGCSESTFLSNLCACSNKQALWCFVHDNVNEKEIYCVKKNNDFLVCV